MDANDELFGMLRRSPFGLPTSFDPGMTAYDSQPASITPQGFIDELDTQFMTDFVLYGVYNGAFGALPPGGLDTDITAVTNELPGWPGGVTQVSGTAITAKVVADSASPSGHNLRFTIAAGAAGDEANVEQIVPVGGVRARRYGYVLRLGVLRVVASGGAPMATIECQYLTAAGATTGSASSGTATLSADATTYVATQTASTVAPPADAAYLRVRAGVKRNTMTASDTATIDATDVRFERSTGTVWLADSSSPGTYGVGAVGQAVGALIIQPDYYNGSGGGIQPSLALSAADGTITYTAVTGYHRLTGGPIQTQEQAAPATPSSGYYAIYAKTDGKLYGKNDAGTEVELGGGGSLTDHTHAATGTGANGGGATLSPTTLSTADGGIATIGGQLAFNNIVYAALSGTKNNWAPTGWDAYVGVLDIDGSSTPILTGLTSTGSAQGRLVVVRVYGGGSSVQINHNSGSSDQDNRFACPNSANMTIRSGGACLFSWAANAVGNNRWQAIAL